jgi:hypothetical protein
MRQLDERKVRNLDSMEGLKCFIKVREVVEGVESMELGFGDSP